MAFNVLVVVLRLRQRPGCEHLAGIVAAGCGPAGIVAGGSGSAAVQRKRKRGCPRPGHVRCTLAQELAEDKNDKAASFEDRIATLAQVCILMLQPCLSALELIGRPCGERWDWDFWEVFSGSG